MKLGRALFSLILALPLVFAAVAVLAQPAALKVAVTAGPHAQIVEVVKKVAERDGLKLQIFEFTDFIRPNAVLAQGEVDLNVYQHVPFLEAQNRDRGYKLAVLALAVRQQLGIYSRKLKSLRDLPEGARVGIPNDPTNGARGLLILRDQGLIKLKDGIGTRASVLDITDNPRKLRIVELEAAQLPRSLDDLDASAVTNNYALQAGLSPLRDAIALEHVDTPFATVVIAVREADRANPLYQRFVRAYQSPEVKAFITEQFKGAYTAAW